MPENVGCRVWNTVFCGVWEPSHGRVTVSTCWSLRFAMRIRACQNVRRRVYGRKTLSFAEFGSLPCPCYNSDLLIPAICDAHTRMPKCKIHGPGVGKYFVLQCLGARDLRCAYVYAKLHGLVALMFFAAMIAWIAICYHWYFHVIWFVHIWIFPHYCCELGVSTCVGFDLKIQCRSERTWLWPQLDVLHF